MALKALLFFTGSVEATFLCLIKVICLQFFYAHGLVGDDCRMSVVVGDPLQLVVESQRHGLASVLGADATTPIGPDDIEGLFLPTINLNLRP